jgi:L-ribulokinase
MSRNGLDQFVIGVDFGTDAVRAVLVDARNGGELASASFAYPRWRDGLYCDPARNQFRQHPLDYIEGLGYTIKACLRQAGEEAASAVRAITIATTGSTPVAVNEEGTPLALMPGFEQNANAMFVLPKDQTAVKEAAEINFIAGKQEVDYLKCSGGVYSPEGYWAKLLHILRADESVSRSCFSFVEHCDWLPFLLTGGHQAMNVKRSRGAAGQKAIWSTEWGGYPPEEFFSLLDHRLRGFPGRLLKRTFTADEPAGFLTPEWSLHLGLGITRNIVIGIGGLDTQMAAVGGQIEPYWLTESPGSILVVPADHNVPGICGSVIPGMISLEAGQSAFGDIAAWFKKLLSWPLDELLMNSKILFPGVAELVREELEGQILHTLSQRASTLALDNDAELAITGFSPGSDAPRIFRALTEAGCFGTKNTIDQLASQEIPVKGIIVTGEAAKKSPYILQLLADGLQLPVRISKAEHSTALGAAMFAATAAGIYPDIQKAMKVMGAGFEKTYAPDPGKGSFYARRYEKYKKLKDQLNQIQ